MRGKVSLIALGVVILLGAAVAGTWALARRSGSSSADADAARARSTFVASRGTPVSGGATSAPNPASGATGATPGSTGAAGSVVAGKAGTPGASDVTGLASTPPVSGTVTKVLSGVFTIQQADGTSVEIATTTETSVTKTKAAALNDVKIGDLVTVEGEKSSDGAYAASAITTLAGVGGPGRPVIAPSGSGGGFVATLPAGASPPTGGSEVFIGAGTSGGGKGAIGKVTKVEGGTLTLEAPDGTTVTVRMDAKTSFRAQVVANVNDIKMGDRVTVIGDKTGDALFTARVIEVGDAPTGG